MKNKTKQSMAGTPKMADVSPENPPAGCGLFTSVFGKSKFWPRRSASASSISTSTSTQSSTSPQTSKRRRNSFHDAAAVNTNRQRVPPVRTGQQMPAAGRSNQTQRKTNKEAMSISGELDNLIAEHQRTKGGNANLLRASSGNVMLYGHLGNLRQPPANQSPSNSKSRNEVQNPRYANSVMGNIVKNNTSTTTRTTKSLVQVNGGGNSLCRAISCRMDPEELKILGNEDYKNGRFAEALSLYERAIDIDPSKASYRSNKSAALAAMGRLLEAAFECREAIEIEPHYHRAHHRLATLYLRLGEAEKALSHFKQAGPEADPDAIGKAKAVVVHRRRCDQARRLKDWNSVLKETQNAVSAGADSAPMIFALQAEALLKMHRHEDAETSMSNGPRFDEDQSVKFFGPFENATLLLIRAQVDMASGRFEEAISAAQRACELDPSNREVGSVTRRARAVASARAQGNDLFKASRFSEASTAYTSGLEHEPYNSVLLCNRAACRSKLGRYEKAVEDCNAALKVRPSYQKARLRRADCNSKLGKWEIAVLDYETLMAESPGNEEVGRFLFEAQIQLKMRRGEDVTALKFGDNDVITVPRNGQFRNFTSSPGLAVVLFCKRPGEKQTLQFMAQICKKYPTIKFLKAEVEDHECIAKSEGVSSFPAFVVYKNGLKAKEIPGDDHELLERSVKEFAK